MLLPNNLRVLVALVWEMRLMFLGVCCYFQGRYWRRGGPPKETFNVIDGGYPTPHQGPSLYSELQWNG